MKAVMVVVGMLLAGPVLADERPTGVMVMRDSDGIVISVIHPVDYGPFLPGVGIGGEIIYMMDGQVLEFSNGVDIAMTDRGGVGPTAVVGGATYKVEVAGQDVWLRDPVTGVLRPTERVRMAQQGGGMQVNPNGFALD